MSQQSNAPMRGGYEDVASLDEVDEQSHVRAVISQRRGHQKYTFALFKCFMRDGQEERTAFFEVERHLPLIVKILPKVQAKIVELETKAVSPGRR